LWEEEKFYCADIEIAEFADGFYVVVQRLLARERQESRCLLGFGLL
jgi:hypothetical protein